MIVNNFKIIMDYIENMQDIDSFEERYDENKAQILNDIENSLKANFESYTTILNDIKDIVSIVEDEAFVMGMYMSLKLFKSIERI